MTTHVGSLGRAAGPGHDGAAPTAACRAVAIVVALTIVTMLARPALAQEDGTTEVKDHMRKAAAAADLGNFAEAAKEYEAAYMQTSDPDLLVSVGQAWERASEPAKAMTAYRSYVRLAPSGAQRGFCAARLRELEMQAMGPASPPPPMPGQAPMGVMPLATPPPPPYAMTPAPPPVYASCEPCVQAQPEPSPVYHRAPFWIVLGTVVVVGAVLGVVYLRQDNDLAMPATTFGTKQF